MVLNKVLDEGWTTKMHGVEHMLSGILVSNLSRERETDTIK